MLVYLGLGSNLGNREEFLNLARMALPNNGNLTILRESRIIKTAPYGNTDQPEFLNQVLELETSLSPLAMLTLIREIEKSAGRQRNEKWGARTLDIDILFWGDEIINREELIIPHPDLHNRHFVLESLDELNPELLHPILKKTVNELYKTLCGGKN
ncbi:MAG: 2-amino-4-hydroxy-6-hydroxymethyldihydropteridine diphosphokinase [Candidatus Cloacimonetes bacterium]|nr:2-amino-4-hydroxy-6-hydroxymethyldihydropteridine diphosphokinase [Candidatus Cloacimonadota bacterium]